MGNTGQTYVDFGTANGTYGGTDFVSVDVGSQSGILSTSYVEAWKAAKSTPTHSLGDVLVSDISLTAGNIIDGVGFTIYARSCMGRLTGEYPVNWVWA